MERWKYKCRFGLRVTCCKLAVRRRPFGYKLETEQVERFVFWNSLAKYPAASLRGYT